MGIKEEITKIAVEQGYDGAKPKSIAQAIDALTDTLAGEDVKGSRTIAGAIHALAPYIGSGGGGVELGDGHIVECARGKQLLAYATRPDDILTATPNIMLTTTGDLNNSMLPAGVYVTIAAPSTTTVSAGGGKIETEIVEVGQGNTIICFVMPDADVSVVIPE